MTSLTPATASQRLLSHINRKVLVVHFRAAQAANGATILKPVFTIDHKIVPRESLPFGGPGERTVCGFTAFVSDTVSHLLEKTRGNPVSVPATEADFVISEFLAKGILVTSANAADVGPGRAVWVDIDLTLEADDSLTISSDLWLEDGTKVAKPTSTAELNQDHGWIPCGRNLVKVRLTGTRLDEVLLVGEEPTLITGDLVPRFLLRLGMSAEAYRTIRRNERLARLRVEPATCHHVLAIRGDDESLVFEARLVCSDSSGVPHAVSRDLIDTQLNEKSFFQRVPTGWLDIPTDEIARFDAAVAELTRSLALGTPVQGDGIPKALTRVREISSDRHGGAGWRVDQAAAGGMHRIIGQNLQPTFTLVVDAADSQLRRTLVAGYRENDITVPHGAVHRSRDEAQDWVRIKDGWVPLSAAVIGVVKRLAEDRGLAFDHQRDGFVLPIDGWRSMVDEFASLAPIRSVARRAVRGLLEVAIASVPGGGIRISSRIIDEDGTELPRPGSPERLAADEWYYAAGDQVVAVQEMRSPLVLALLEQAAEVELPADDVGDFLHRLKGAPIPGVRLVMDDGVGALTFSAAKPRHRLVVRSEADGLAVQPVLTLTGDDGVSTDLRPEDVRRLSSENRHLVRVRTGWLVVDAAVADEFLARCRLVASKLPLGTKIHGQRIPEALTALQALEQTSSGSPNWACEWEADLKDRERVVRETHRPHFDIARVGRDGRAMIHVRPSYVSGCVTLSHQTVSEAVRDELDWVKAEGAWHLVPQQAKVQIDALITAAGGCEEQGGYIVPPTSGIARSLQDRGTVRDACDAAEEGSLEVGLRLGEDDTLEIKTVIRGPSGEELPLPRDVGAFISDDGLYALGDRHVRIEGLPTDLVPILFSTRQPAVLSGESVPRFVKDIPTLAGVATVQADRSLENVVVWDGEPSSVLEVEGNETAITVRPRLHARYGKDESRAIDVTPSREAIATATIDTFTRVEDGWVRTHAQAVDAFREAVRGLADSVEINQPLADGQIPQTLETLARLRTDAVIPGGCWAISIAPNLVAIHGRDTTKADIDIAIEIAAHDGKASFAVVPTYRHGDAVLRHDEAIEATTRNSGWVRRDKRWVRVDAAAIADVTKHARRASLALKGDRFPFEHRSQPRIAARFADLGPIRDVVVNGGKATVDVDLDLDDNDRLRVASRVTLPNGGEIEKPASLAEAVSNDGWIASGDRVAKLPLSGTEFDNTFLSTASPSILSFDAVPRFLATLDAVGNLPFKIRRGPALKDLRVIEGHGESYIDVSGDESQVQLQGRLRVVAKDGSVHDLPDSVANTIDTSAEVYSRTPEGWVRIPTGTAERYRRNQQALESILPMGRTLEGSEIPDALRALAKLQASNSLEEYQLHVAPEVERYHRVTDAPATTRFRLDVIAGKEHALLHLDPIYNHDRFRISHEQMQAAAARGDSWLRTGTDWVRLDLAAYRRVAEKAKEAMVEAEGGGFSFSPADMERIVPMFSAIGTIEQTEAFVDFLEQLADFTAIEPAPRPVNIRDDVQLRPYQQHGYDWLAFLQRFGLHGILADDMGLGKTLQTLFAIERAREISGEPRPALIVCPASVVHNWRAEIDRFLQKSDVLLFHGTNRRSVSRILEALASGRPTGRSCDYVITTYGVAVQDAAKLARVPWLYVAVDEGHHIKNPAAKRTKAIKRIAGRHRIALTGTPIQNNLDELWSLFDFAMPGYLGSRAEFGNSYDMSDRDTWSTSAPLLRQRIRPFVLRRLKKDVAKDLPDKVMVDRLFELTPIQVGLYKQHLESHEFREMVEEIDARGVKRSHVHILRTIRILSDICNHPALAPGYPPSSTLSVKESAKLVALKELLEEVIQGDHRALIFSRSKRMLKMLSMCLEAWRVRHLHFSGDTPPRERARLVERFNTTTEESCFLLTMAGNTGINLTGADTVIFYDHDWNPANDAQAADRAYRIGQTRKVTVYRLISRGTIEERIIERQKAKQTLADEVITSDSLGFKELTQEELLALFQPPG